MTQRGGPMDIHSTASGSRPNPDDVSAGVLSARNFPSEDEGGARDPSWSRGGLAASRDLKRNLQPLSDASALPSTCAFPHRAWASQADIPAARRSRSL